MFQCSMLRAVLLLASTKPAIDSFDVTVKHELTTQLWVLVVCLDFHLRVL